MTRIAKDNDNDATVNTITQRLP